MRRNTLNTSSHNGIRSRNCEVEVFELFQHGS